VGGRGKEKLWGQILYSLSIIKLTRFYKPSFFPTLLKTPRRYSMGELGSATVNSATAKCAVTENRHYYVWYHQQSRSMRFKPISVWLYATLSVAESHKINTQSTCSRQLIISKLFILTSYKH
jgi:hypothetical protein